MECTDSAGEAAQVYYDKLVICTGTQFCCPQFANASEPPPPNPAPLWSVILSVEVIPFPADPPLVWAISDSHQSSKFLHWIKTELIPGEGTCVFY